MVEVVYLTDLMTVTGVTVGDYVKVTSTGIIYQWVSGDQANLNNWIATNGETAYKYEGGLPIAVGYSLQTNRPLDEREIVSTKNDLALIPNCYAGMIVKVEDEDYRLYQWNGVNQTDLSNWAIVTDANFLNVNITGSDTVANIKAIASPTNGEVWIATDTGTDDFGNPVAQYDGLLYNGTGWLDIGPLQGPKGDQGVQGEQGDQGVSGTSATISAGTTTTLAPGSSATVVNVGTDLDGVFDFGIPQGEKGDTGDQGVSGISATISAGTTTTLSAGTDATVVNVGDDLNAVFDFGIPQGIQGVKGDKGDTGDQGVSGDSSTIAIGTTTTLSGGSDATVVNVGTPSAAILDFGIPQGIQGDKGDKGDTGDTGAGVISGGTTGQALIKSSNADYDTEWGDIDLTGKTDVTLFDSHTGDTSNPHSVTKTQVGLSNVDNTSDVDKPVSTAQQTALNLKANQTDLNTHTGDTANPHSVTKTQVGLPNVLNVTQASQTDLNTHTGDTSNPHSVTKAQVGLPNVLNVEQASQVDLVAHSGDSAIHVSAQDRIDWDAGGDSAGQVQATSATTLGYLEDVLVGGTGTTVTLSGNSLVVDTIGEQGTNEYNDLEFVAQDAPLTVSDDTFKMYALSGGTSPNHIVTLAVMNENLEQIIVATYKS